MYKRNSEVAKSTFEGAQNSVSVCNSNKIRPASVWIQKIFEKFRSDFEKDSAWAEAFDEDDEELIEGIQNPQLDEQEFDHSFFLGP